MVNNVADAAAAFIDARASRPHWPGVPASLCPTTITEAYQVQQAIHARLATQGVKRIGYKIGSTSPANQRPWGPIRSPTPWLLHWHVLCCIHRWNAKSR
jgi:2-keto-4-pentenoate hydratase